MTEQDAKVLGRTAKTWWQSLQPATIEDDHNGRGDRAALARLRRTSNALEAVAEPQTARLFRGLGSPVALERVAVLAAVLAHVREDTAPVPLARAAGPTDKADDKTATLSRLRLRKLLTAETEEDILIGFRRLVALLGNKANVADLARNILDWNSEKTRVRFAFDYWSAGDAAPGHDAESAPNTPSHSVV